MSASRVTIALYIVIILLEESKCHTVVSSRVWANNSCGSELPTSHTGHKKQNWKLGGEDSCDITLTHSFSCLADVRAFSGNPYIFYIL